MGRTSPALGFKDENNNMANKDFIKALVSGKAEALSSLINPVGSDNIFHKDEFDLKNAKMSKKQKMAHYSNPDYCIITRADSFRILRLELQNLCKDAGVYYRVYHEVKNKRDVGKSQNLIRVKPEDLLRIVIFMDETKIDQMAEKLKVLAKVKNYDCNVPFDYEARQMFE